MLNGLFFVFFIGAIYQYVKEKSEPVIPAENWENQELYYEDVANGISATQRIENVKNGKYKVTKTFPKPHRNESGKIIIENNLLYKKDIKEYGVRQTMKWADQGKYNLSPEELKKERKRIEKKFEYLYSL